MEKNAQRQISHALKQMVESSPQEHYTIGKILKILSGRGYPFLLIFLCLPFCFPITIPGLSTPFGLAIAFSGLRIAFAKKPWWPKYLLNKKISRHSIEKLTLKIQRIEQVLKKFVHVRWKWLIQNPSAHRIHGLNIFFLGIILASPLPIPMTNMAAALPILFISLGLLENDGLMVCLGYFFAAICYSYFFFIIWFSKQSLTYLLNF